MLTFAVTESASAAGQLVCVGSAERKATGGGRAPGVVGDSQPPSPHGAAIAPCKPAGHTAVFNTC